jgi:hypothetical protein
MTNPRDEDSPASRRRQLAAPVPQAPAGQLGQALRWPFPAGSQNATDKAVVLKPYVPPKRRGLNLY